MLFGFGSDQDFKDASQVIAVADQGGMSLPDKDYYLKDDAKSVEIRKQFAEHVQKMFELLGDPMRKSRGRSQDGDGHRDLSRKARWIVPAAASPARFITR